MKTVRQVKENQVKTLMDTKVALTSAQIRKRTRQKRHLNFKMQKKNSWTWEVKDTKSYFESCLSWARKILHSSPVFILLRLPQFRMLHFITAWMVSTHKSLPVFWSVCCINLWCQLLPGWVNPSFEIYDIRALWRSAMSVAMSVRVPGCQQLQITT